MKTLVVGLDAACWEYVRPLIDADQLPALKALMTQGIWGKLVSTMPPWTPTAWATISTGKNPGKHGVFDMLWRNPTTNVFTATSGSLRRGTPFWARLNEAGLRVGLVNVPFTYPPEPIDGFVVAGFGSPETATDIVYPGAAARWVREHEPGLRPVVSAKILNSEDPDLILKAEIEHQSSLVNVALGLSDQIRVDVLVINLMLTDHANHKMPDAERIAEAYRRSDADVQRLLDGYEPDAVMLISDHGSSRLHGEFMLYQWLRDNGYLIPIRRTAQEKRDVLNWLLAVWLEQQGLSKGVLEGAARRVMLTALRSLPAGMTKPFWRRLERDMPGAADFLEYQEAPDTDKSKVLPGSVYSGLLYLNGNYPQAQNGSAADGREAMAEKLVDQLQNVVVPESDQPLFSAVCRTEDLYGDVADGAPDLILDAYGGEWNIRSARHVPRPGRSRVDGYFLPAEEYGDLGWHSRHGLYVFSGSCFLNSAPAVDAELADMPATLLHLYDVAQPDDLDGRVLYELLAGHINERPVRYQAGDTEPEGSPQGLSEEESEHLLSHLRALGYLE